MSTTDDKRIREFAYQIWESEGKPEGQEHRHWEMARKLAEAEALAPKKPAKAAGAKVAGKTADSAAGKALNGKASATKTKAKASPATSPAIAPVEKIAAKKPRAPRKPAV
ncbi:DUF2934 domain-containing protein [Pseudomonas sp. NPDC089569]|uniref:DUF2934 domain-containing protein n=1 Tax=Pseudomonas sp. NPDC089569 TaxID=3390722 RepID=UPI003D06877C